MENKKNIIDGVDVSECEYANACDKKLKCVILQDDVCETKPYCEGYNCYYKQLKRLENENARLKNGLKHYKRCLYKITSIANECTNSKMWDFKGV